MRDLQQSDSNSITVQDKLSGSELVLRYRMPTNAERIAYQRSLMKREGQKVRIQVFEARVKHGLSIITGFRDGDFGFGGAPISADPQSTHYRQDWKELLAETASDVVATVAAAVFESATVAGGPELDFVDEGEAEDVPPLPKS